jgi:hypothetical protein
MTAREEEQPLRDKTTGKTNAYRAGSCVLFMKFATGPPPPAPSWRPKASTANMVNVRVRLFFDFGTDYSNNTNLLKKLSNVRPGDRAGNRLRTRNTTWSQLDP